VTRLAAALCVGALATCLGSASAAKQGGIFLVGTTGASVQIDPQVSYVTTAWWLQYATAAKLYNYPDERGPAGALLRPEVASRFTVSRDGKTYTFTIRTGFRFSDGSPVNARSFEYAIERALNRDLASPAAQFITDPNGTNIVGAKEFYAGDAKRIRGVRIKADRLIVRLTRPDGTFLSKITLPFFQATSTKLPLANEVTAGYPSAGPYYFSRNEVDELTSIRRNPYWKRGPGRQRPRHLSGVDVQWGLNEQTAFQQVLADGLDEGPLPSAEVQAAAERFGVNKTRFWTMPVNCTGFISFNNEKGVFAKNPALRKAVNWAVDRRSTCPCPARTRGGPGRISFHRACPDRSRRRRVSRTRRRPISRGRRGSRPVTSGTARSSSRPRAPERSTQPWRIWCAAT
jgi:peptide/nickel transport system substrate-binding protein